MLNEAGYQIDTIFACGGGTKNSVFLREHADITGCRIVLSREPESVLLSSAMLGAVAASDHANLLTAMSGAGVILSPNKTTAPYHQAKYDVFRRLHADQQAYRERMQNGIAVR